MLVVPHEKWRVKWWADRSDGEVLTLADPGYVASSLFGVAFQMRIHSDTSNTPATFLIDEKGLLRWSHVGTGPKNWNDRPTVEEMLTEVRALADD